MQTDPMYSRDTCWDYLRLLCTLNVFAKKRLINDRGVVTGELDSRNRLEEGITEVHCRHRELGAVLCSLPKVFWKLHHSNSTYKENVCCHLQVAV